LVAEADADIRAKRHFGGGDGEAAIGEIVRGANGAVSDQGADEVAIFLFEREIDVLRLVAAGLDTSEIAGKLAYSERTIKNVIHDITSRLCLRNRTHAVAWAVREGLI
jgi:DNA-binding NarL/FixJ family response regulator